MLPVMAALLTIGDFSRMTFLSVKTLRHYHDVGLLTPAEVDPETGYRRYDAAQLAKAQVIRRLRELDMPLEEVRAVMEAPDVDARNAAISAHLQRMEGELERTRETVKSLRLLLDEERPPAIPVDFRVVEATDALAIRDVIEHADMLAWLDAAIGELRATLDEVGAHRVGPDAALFSSELLENELGEIVVLVPVARAEEAAGRVRDLHFPRTEYAVAVHSGPLEDIDRTYAALGMVVAERAIGVPGSIRENYLVGTYETPEEAQHRTEICWPVFQTTPTG